MDVVAYKTVSNWKEISPWSNVGMSKEKFRQEFIDQHCRECSFVTKSLNAEKSGARGVLIMDNDPTADDYLVQMLDDTTGRIVNIPAMFLQYRDGYEIDRENIFKSKEIFFV